MPPNNNLLGGLHFARMDNPTLTIIHVDWITPLGNNSRDMLKRFWEKKWIVSEMEISDFFVSVSGTVLVQGRQFHFVDLRLRT